jgi:hypothetical protein
MDKRDIIGELQITIDTLKDIEIRKGEGSTFLLNAILGTLLNQLIESRYCFSHIRVIYKSPMPYSTDEGCEAVKDGEARHYWRTANHY